MSLPFWSCYICFKLLVKNSGEMLWSFFSCRHLTRCLDLLQASFGDWWMLLLIVDIWQGVSLYCNTRCFTTYLWRFLGDDTPESLSCDSYAYTIGRQLQGTQLFGVQGKLYQFSLYIFMSCSFLWIFLCKFNCFFHDYLWTQIPMSGFATLTHILVPKAFTNQTPRNVSVLCTDKNIVYLHLFCSFCLLSLPSVAFSVFEEPWVWIKSE